MGFLLPPLVIAAFSTTSIYRPEKKGETANERFEGRGGAGGWDIIL